MLRHLVAALPEVFHLLKQVRVLLKSTGRNINSPEEKKKELGTDRIGEIRSRTHTFPGTKIITGEYKIVAVKYKNITGEYKIITGEYKIVAGEYTIITGQYKVITGEYKIITGEYEIAILPF